MLGRYARTARPLAAIFVVAIAASTASVGEARADGPTETPAARSERAAALFKQAQLAFERRAFGAAAAAFEEAAQLTPHAATWLNAGEARELDGNLPRALSDYDRALTIEGATETLKREASKRVARLEPRVATVDLIAKRATIVKIDSREEVTAPRIHRLAPGHHALEIVEQPPRTLEIDVVAGETRRIEVSSAEPTSIPAPAPAPAVEQHPAEPAPSSGGGPPALAWVAFGTAAAAGAAGAVFGALTLSAKSSFTDAPTLARRDSFYLDRTITNVAFVIAGVAALAGVGLWVATPRTASSRTGVLVTTSGVGLAHEARF